MKEVFSENFIVRIIYVGEFGFKESMIDLKLRKLCNVIDKISMNDFLMKYTVDWGTYRLI